MNIKTRISRIIVEECREGKRIALNLISLKKNYYKTRVFFQIFYQFINSTKAKYKTKNKIIIIMFSMSLEAIKNNHNKKEIIALFVH